MDADDLDAIEAEQARVGITDSHGISCFQLGWYAGALNQNRKAKRLVDKTVELVNRDQEAQA